MKTAFDGLDRPTLALLVREYLLCGHLIDRAGMPHVLAAGGIDAMREIAIEEWMGASPIYTRRVRRALAFAGDDVATIFKGMQIDIGAPPQYMDFRFSVTDAKHGEFQLASCGALRDVEPMGDEYVVNMCHHIEDPTFDATAAATNPKARMRPIHRPPRSPAGRVPNCHWTVEIDESVEALSEPEEARRIGSTRAALHELPPPEGDDSEGLTSYDGPLVADIRFEEFSKNTLITLLQEISLQWHLLALSFFDAAERRFGTEAAAEIGTKQLTGIAGLTGMRLKRALKLGESMSDMATMLDLHPAFHPRSYFGMHVDHADALTISLRDCPAIGDRPGRSWAEYLSDGASAPLDAVVRSIDRRARCEEVDAPDGALRAWSVSVAGNPADESREVRVTRISTGAEFSFEER
jgi:hypothetical protein